MSSLYGSGCNLLYQKETKYTYIGKQIGFRFEVDCKPIKHRKYLKSIKTQFDLNLENIKLREFKYRARKNIFNRALRKPIFKNIFKGKTQLR